MIPKDNGRAFRAKYFTDDKGFTELGFQGLYSKLGIETVFALRLHLVAAIRVEPLPPKQSRTISLTLDVSSKISYINCSWNLKKEQNGDY